MKIRSYFLSVAMAFVVALPAKAGDEPISLMLDWTPSAIHGAIYWAKEKKFFSREQVDVDIIAPSDPTTPLKLVATGNVDIAVSYAPETILARKEGLSVTMVGSLVPRPLVAMMAPASAGIGAMEDLRGRKIGYSGIPTYLALIKAMVKNSGLRLDEVEIVNVGYNLIPAVLAGSVDAIGDGFINDQVAQIEQQTGATAFVRTVDSLGVPSYDESVFVADSKRLATDESYRNRVKAFLKAYYEGTADAMTHPDEVVSLMEEVTNRESNYLRINVPLSLNLMRPASGNIGCISAQRYKDFSAWMLEYELISELPDLDALIDNSYLPTSCN